MTARILVAHAAWAPGRSDSLARLCRTVEPDVVYRSRVREPVHVFARRLWEDIATNGDGIYLEDDVIAHPRLREIVDVMATVVPGRVLSLHAAYPLAREHARRSRWAVGYNLTGPCHFFPQSQAVAFLEWVERCPQGWARAVFGDTLAIHWAYSIRRPFWLSLPALVAHDTSIRSALGNDLHVGRTTEVPWTCFDLDYLSPETWRPDPNSPSADCPWITPDTLQRCDAELTEHFARTPRWTSDITAMVRRLTG